MHRDLLAHHVRSLAAQHVHLHDRFNGPKIQFDLPALTIQRDQFALIDLVVIEQRADQSQIPDAHFAHEDGLRQAGVSGQIHPGGPLRT
jgi:hypothetical protein